MITGKKRKCNNIHIGIQTNNLQKKSPPSRKLYEKNSIYNDEIGTYCIVKRGKTNYFLYTTLPSLENVAVDGKIKPWGKNSISFDTDLFVGYNHYIGRLYYAGFHWNMKQQFLVGDLIEITTNGNEPEQFTIVNCFIGTKSYYQYNRVEKTTLSIQETGKIERNCLHISITTK